VIESIEQIFPDDHYCKIIKVNPHFFKTDDVLMVKLEKCLEKISGGYILCFTNRCGSNYLSEIIASSGLYVPAGENLNYEVIVDCGYIQKNIYEYLIFLFEETLSLEGNMFSIKMSIGQILTLYKFKLLNKFLNKFKLIYIFRENVIAQAVSHQIALQNNQWSSLQQKNDIEVTYNFEKILKTACQITYENSIFLLFFKTIGLNYLKIKYEDLILEDKKILNTLNIFLSGSLTFNLNNISLKKQFDGKKSNFIDLFINDFRKLM
jgi:LPS sulfotransferase NodH